MLEVGRQKIKSKALDGIIKMVIGDSEDLPFKDIDIIFSALPSLNIFSIQLFSFLLSIFRRSTRR